MCDWAALSFSREKRKTGGGASRQATEQGEARRGEAATRRGTRGEGKGRDKKEERKREKVRFVSFSFNLS